MLSPMFMATDLTDSLTVLVTPFRPPSACSSIWLATSGGTRTTFLPSLKSFETGTNDRLPLRSEKMPPLTS